MPKGKGATRRPFAFKHDPRTAVDRVGQEERTVTLDDDANFFTWAAEQWAAPRWTVDLDPWQDGSNYYGCA